MTVRIRTGSFGAWFNPTLDDDSRVRFTVEAEALGYGTAWLGLGRRIDPHLTLVQRALDATGSIVVATAIVNMWTNDPAVIAAAYRRLADRHPGRFLLGVGIGHPESIGRYALPYDTMVSYLDALDAGGVPTQGRILAALGPRALRLARDRASGTHPYLVVPDHTRRAREVLGPGPLLAPEHAVVLDTDRERARRIGRDFVSGPYLDRRNYVANLLRHGFGPEDVAGRGSDRLIDGLVLHGNPESIRPGLLAHLDAGADHVGIQVVTEAGADPMPAYRALAAVLPIDPQPGDQGHDASAPAGLGFDSPGGVGGAEGKSA